MRKAFTCTAAAVLAVGGLIGPPDAAAGGTDDLAFLSIGAGPGSRPVAGVVSLNLSRGRMFYAVRAATTTEFNILGPSPDESDTDYAVLVGTGHRSGRAFSSVAGGLGVVHTVRRGALREARGWFFGGAYERLDRTTVGLAVDLKTGVSARGIGIGLNAFGNLNAKASFAAVAVTLQLGKQR